MKRTIKKCLIFQAYSDAYGKFVEFLTKEQIAGLYPYGLEFTNIIQNEHNSTWKTYEWTDDTDLTILVVRTISEIEKEDIQSNMPYLKRFAKHLKKWYIDGGRGVGNYVRWVINHELFDTDPYMASQIIGHDADNESTENGALMRTGIIGCLITDYDKIVQISTEISLTTHFSWKSMAVCIFQSLLVRMLLDRKHNQLDIIISNCLCKTKDYLNDKQYIYLAGLVEPVINDKYNPYDTQIDHPYHRGEIDCTLPLALWSILRIKYQGFFNIIRQIAKFGGDTDTNCAVAGVLLGACLNYSSLPSDYKQMDIKKLCNI
jgi:ADP-ribosylglycohydrolase